MYLRLGLLAFAGLGAGAVIAAGIFAFLAIIGVFPRLIGVTHTAEHVLLYETLLILGGVWKSGGSLPCTVSVSWENRACNMRHVCGDLCRLSRDVTCGDVKGAPCFKQTDPACGGTSVCDPGCGIGESVWGSSVFYKRFRIMKSCFRAAKSPWLQRNPAKCLSVCAG